MATVTITIICGTGGTATPITGLQTVGTPISLVATPTSGYDFLNWVTGVTTTTNAVLAVTPSVDATYTASFVLHDITVDDLAAIDAFQNQYAVAAGISGSTPNAAKANRMLPNILLLGLNLNLFDKKKALSQNTAPNYAIIAQILSDFYPVVIPIV